MHIVILALFFFMIAYSSFLIKEVGLVDKKSNSSDSNEPEIESVLNKNRHVEVELVKDMKKVIAKRARAEGISDIVEQSKEIKECDDEIIKIYNSKLRCKNQTLYVVK